MPPSVSTGYPVGRVSRDLSVNMKPGVSFKLLQINIYACLENEIIFLR